MNTDSLGYAVVDHERYDRCGHHEVVFSEGKTSEQIIGIVNSMLSRGVGRILATRVDAGQYKDISSELPDARYHKEARLVTIERVQPDAVFGKVALVTAGTSDIPVAEEAAITAAFFGHETERIYDVGVAGLHRLLSRLDDIRGADVIIVVAGMEGALPSVVGGLTERPLIAVPTSIGYGANFAGLSALLAMLNSCAAGVGVVNIDNGFGAAMLAHKILMLHEGDK